ncbi:SMI1/KNR4 family protein [Rossellomorea sp. SC111]|uniref:SMI1/KNR4 family protein n=1 Tax=Rossellomorea sp. SC111 TaxID=2968985 RepID=UPI00215AAB46|nr:SMI1/KNR4 family protein [Rossellomorea sp. SC111]MCR8848221.1 SMI1/KNR4 family protein [Rossellomorea sp. SC111]
MKWRNYLGSLSEECQFKAPATESEISTIKETLKLELPGKLAQLYNETNGVFGNYGISYIWSTEQVVRENIFCRTGLEFSENMNSLLFFSDAGNGDLFGYSLVKGRIQSENIYIWNHEDRNRRVVSTSLDKFIEGWITGELNV